MAYIRTKKVKGREYQYLVEGYRDSDGKVKQRTIKYLGAVNPSNRRGKSMVNAQLRNITFEEYLNYDDGTDNRYELVDGELVLMPPATARHSDIVDFICDRLKETIARSRLDMRVKAGDVGVRTGANRSRIPDVSVVEGSVWRSLPRDASAVIQTPLVLAVEVVSPGTEQIERDYTDKATEYQNTGITEYWIVDPIEQKITVGVLKNGSYSKTVFASDEAIASNVFPQLKVTANEILSA